LALISSENSYIGSFDKASIFITSGHVLANLFDGSSGDQHLPVSAVHTALEHGSCDDARLSGKADKCPRTLPG
jgi:hypothetical protein